MFLTSAVSLSDEEHLRCFPKPALLRDPQPEVKSSSRAHKISICRRGEYALSALFHPSSASTLHGAFLLKLEMALKCGACLRCTYTYETEDEIVCIGEQQAEREREREECCGWWDMYDRTRYARCSANYQIMHQDHLEALLLSGVRCN